MNKRKTASSIVLTSVILLIAAIVSLCMGKFKIQVSDLVKIIFLNGGTSMERTVFFKLRLPRTIMALLAGAGLGLAGAVFQIIFKNPLASPDIIGVSSGVNLGAAVAIVISSYSMTAVGFGAFAGGLAAVGFVMLLVRYTKSNTTATYVLSGIIISSIAKAMIMLLKYYADSDSQLAAIEYWTMGSLASVTLEKLIYVFILWIIGFTGTMLLHRQIGLLNLNEDECKALGVRTSRIRTMVLGFSTLLISSIISVTGLISFTGLIAPHIARFIVKTKNKVYLYMSSLVGAAVLVISDILARCLGSAEIPISILTTIIGVPVLVYFMVKRSRGRV